MRARFALPVCAFLALAVAVTGCRQKPPENQPRNAEPGTGTASGPTLVPDDPNPNVGGLLYTAREFPKYPPAPLPGTEAMVIANCPVQYEERQTVAAEVDGKVELIATPMELRDGGLYQLDLRDGSRVTYDPKTGKHEVRNPDGKTEPFDRKNPHPRLVFAPRDQAKFKDDPSKWVPHYALREGEPVGAEQVLCLLDDSVYTTRMNAAMKIKEASSKGVEYAKEGLRLTELKIERTKTTATPLELLNDQVTLSRFGENLAQSFQSIAKAEADSEEAQVMLGKHRVRSRVEGIVRSISKRPGEFVRAGEKIFEVQSTEKVRLEGNLDVQYADRVRRNMLVTIEPAVPSAPVRSIWGHRREVAGVAVTGDAERPLVVSAGLDGIALVWDPNLPKDGRDPKLPDPDRRPTLRHNLPHPVGVRCVAATPPGVKPPLAITGGDDGKVRIWTLADPTRLPDRPTHEPADAHGSGVAVVAVSPDGRYAATAAGREVFVWDLVNGKRLYALPESHRDGITSLAFTPQCELVTAAKDRALKRWKIGAEKAAVVRTLDHRSGAVDVLGVSPDGGRVLFDQGKDRIDLVNLSDAQTVGQLTNVGPSVAFATLALFAPDFSDPKTPPEQLPPYRVVTAGGEGDLKGGLQVWDLPRAGGRGAERARLITPGRAAVTCAAFSPHQKARFLVVGTAAGTVHVWTPPTDRAKELDGRITNIDSTDPRYVTVRVEMDNKNVGLLDRSAATVIVHPGQ